MFKNVTQAVKCLMPVYLLFGTALPLVATLIISSVSSASSATEENKYIYESETMYRLLGGILFLTTPLFTFYISCYSIVISHTTM